MSTQLNAQQGLTNLTPIKVIHILISLAIMVCFKFVPAAEPLTPLGVEVIGIFLGMLYGWLIANDSFWPSIFGLLFLGLSSYSTVPAVLRDGFGNSTVLLLFFFFAFTNIISAAGITEYIARWIVSRKVVQGRPYLLTLMIFLAMCALVIMVSCAAATMVIFPLIKEICRLYGVKPGSKWASITLVGTICVGCSFYMLLPFKSLPAVVFSSYTQMSGGDSIALVPYLAIVVVITAITMALLLVLMKFVLRCDVSVIASSNKSMEELPKLSRYQKFIMVFFVAVIVLLLFPSFVPKTFIVSTVLNNVGATGILLGAVGVYIMVSLKEGMPAVQLFSKNIGWSIIFILAAALSIADAMAAESTGISAWLVELITPVVQGKSPLVLTAVMCVVGMGLTNVANNIATAAMLTPIAYSVGIACGANPAALAVCVLLATNMGMATPPASAPAAIVHGEKEWIPGSDAVKYGLVCCGITLVLILAVIFPMANVMF